LYSCIFIVIMIKKFHLDSYTPKAREPPSKDVNDTIEKPGQNRRVRALSHFRGSGRKQHISMFEPSGLDESKIVLSPEDNAKNKLDSNGKSNKEFGRLFGRNK
jgi:hypothetical protein